jgi:predicted small integral membrane protein
MSTTLILRLSKVACVAAVALFASVVAFGNVTDYGTNWAFVQHVLAMDTIFPDSTIRWRAVTAPTLQQASYIAIIAAEALTALLCWIGAWRLLAATHAPAGAFAAAKGFAIAGLTLGFLIWQVGFMTIGGEWFGMWQSTQWNGIASAFRFQITILAVLIYVALPEPG